MPPSRTRRRLLGLSTLAVGAALLASVMWPTRQSQVPSGGHPDAEAKLAVVLPEVHFKSMPLREVITRLVEQSGVNLVAEWPALEADGVAADMPIDLQLRNVTLDGVLSALTGYVSSGPGEIDYTAAGDTIVVTTPNRMAAHAYARLYDVRDLHADRLKYERHAAATYGPRPASEAGLFAGTSAEDPEYLPTPQEMDDEIMWTIMSTVDPDCWRDNGGSVGQMQTMSGRILVVAAWKHHREIEGLLQQLRSPMPPKPAAPDLLRIVGDKPEDK